MTTADRVRDRIRQPAFVRVAATVISDPRRALRDTGLTVAGSESMLGPELAANTLVAVIADEAAAVAQADADQHEPDHVVRIVGALRERADRHDASARPLLAHELRDVAHCIESRFI